MVQIKPSHQYPPPPPLPPFPQTRRHAIFSLIFELKPQRFPLSMKHGLFSYPPPPPPPISTPFSPHTLTYPPQYILIILLSTPIFHATNIFYSFPTYFFSSFFFFLPFLYWLHHPLYTFLFFLFYSPLLSFSFVLFSLSSDGGESSVTSTTNTNFIFLFYIPSTTYPIYPPISATASTWQLLHMLSLKAAFNLSISKST